MKSVNTTPKHLRREQSQPRPSSGLRAPPPTMIQTNKSVPTILERLNPFKAHGFDSNLLNLPTYESMVSISTHSSPRLRAIQVAERGMSLNDSELKPLINELTPLMKAVSENAPQSSTKLSFWRAVFTIINMFLGLGALSLPYALARGSIYSLVLLFAVAIAGYVTATFLINVCVEINEFTYAGVAHKLYREKGMSVTLVIVCLELMGAIIMSILFLWNNLFFLIGSHYFLIALISAIAITPTVWLLDFAELSILNTIGFSTNVVFCVTTVLLLFFSSKETGLSDEVPRQINDMTLSFGIYLLCFAGHPCIPPVYKCMEKPEQFPTVLKTAFGIMVCIYAAIGIAGVSLYGHDTKPLLTQNMGAWPAGWVGIVVTSLIIIRSFVTVSSLVGMFAEMPEEYIFHWHRATPMGTVQDQPGEIINHNVRKQTEEARQQQEKTKCRLFRTASLWVFIALSYLMRSSVEYVEAITGSLISIVVVFAFPPFFYLNAFGSTSSKCVRIFCWTLIIGAFVIGLFLTTEDVVKIVNPVVEVVTYKLFEKIY